MLAFQHTQILILYQLPVMDDLDVDLILSDFGAIVRRLRTEKEVSLRSVADIMETDPSWLSQIERGRVDVQLSTLFKIAAALNISVHDLLPAT